MATASRFCCRNCGAESDVQNDKLNGVDPAAYLRHVLERIADHPINRIDEPLSWNVAQSINAVPLAG